MRGSQLSQRSIVFEQDMKKSDEEEKKSFESAIRLYSSVDRC